MSEPGVSWHGGENLEALKREEEGDVSGGSCNTKHEPASKDGRKDVKETN